MSKPALFWNATSSSLDTEDVKVSEVLVHPLVLLSVLDHHTRRQEGAGRVIGTLLGRREGTKVEVTNCFAVPHAERGEEVAIGKDFNRQMLALHTRANRNEIVVGWYATSDEGGEPLVDTSSLIQDFYTSECGAFTPIHLVCDTSLQNNELSIKAYQSTPVTVGGEPLATLFHELQLTLSPHDSERIVLDHMIRSSTELTSTTETSKEEDDPSKKDDLTQAMKGLQGLLEQVSSYVDGVVENGCSPEEEAKGRQIADALNTVPRIRNFDTLFHDSLQDLLMVTYLSNLTKTQLTIAEKLNATLSTDLK